MTGSPRGIDGEHFDGPTSDPAAAERAACPDCVHDGGPAYPIVVDPKSSALESTGVTVRDYFAAAAFSAVIASRPGRPSDIARAAYQYADAMIAARAGQPVADDMTVEALGRIVSEASRAIERAQVRP